MSVRNVWGNLVVFMGCQSVRCQFIFMMLLSVMLSAGLVTAGGLDYAGLNKKNFFPDSLEELRDHVRAEGFFIYAMDGVIDSGQKKLSLTVKSCSLDSAAVNDEKIRLLIYIFDAEKNDWVLGENKKNFVVGSSEVIQVGFENDILLDTQPYAFFPVKLVARSNKGGVHTAFEHTSMVAVGRSVNKPPAVVFDLDETLSIAIKNDDEDGGVVTEYKPMTGMLERVLEYAQKGYAVFYVTARDWAGLPITRIWLESQDLPPGPIFMQETSKERYQSDKEKWVRASKTVHIKEIQKSFSVEAAFGDGWVDMDVYQKLGVKNLFYVEWPSSLSPDTEASFQDNYAFTGAQSYTQGNDSWVLKHYVQKGPVQRELDASLSESSDSFSDTNDEEPVAFETTQPCRSKVRVKPVRRPMSMPEDDRAAYDSDSDTGFSLQDSNLVAAQKRRFLRGGAKTAPTRPRLQSAGFYKGDYCERALFGSKEGMVDITTSLAEGVRPASASRTK